MKVWLVQDGDGDVHAVTATLKRALWEIMPARDDNRRVTMQGLCLSADDGEAWMQFEVGYSFWTIEQRPVLSDADHDQP
jgi:hypothetical protein